MSVLWIKSKQTFYWIRVNSEGFLNLKRGQFAILILKERHIAHCDYNMLFIGLLHDIVKNAKFNRIKYVWFRLNNFYEHLIINYLK